MDRTTDLAPENAVNEAVLLEPRHTGESRGRDGRTEVIAATGPVFDLGLSSRDSRLDARLYVRCVWHSPM